jgi:hypothetical protein
MSKFTLEDEIMLRVLPAIIGRRNYATNGISANDMDTIQHDIRTAYEIADLVMIYRDNVEHYRRQREIERAAKL